MTMDEKLVERLRKINANYDLSRGIHATITEAATALPLAQARIRELETALAPFAEAGEMAAISGQPPGYHVDANAFTRARQALKEASE